MRLYPRLLGVDKGNLLDDKSARRDIIYDKIVRPLWNIAKPPQVSRPVNKRHQVEESHRKIPNKGTVVLYYIQETPKDPNILAAANDFIRHLNDFTKAHVPIISQDIQHYGHYDRVKVAIIDSGVVLRADWLRRAKKDGRFIEGKCWIAGRDSNDFNDFFGHGIDVAHQLLFAAPNAAIYIAKIADEKEISDDQTGVIAKAIEYAVDVWKVDIISLSLGLEASNTRIAAAIDKATANKSTLVFAAARNHGIHKHQTWPAHRYDVIGINAADGNGGSTQSFNPFPVPNRPNFATLGIGTRSTWKGDEVRRSGTSFAVPIVAIAAKLAAATAMLDEVHGKPTRQDPRDKNNYAPGRISQHNTVTACLSDGVYGMTAATAHIISMLSSYKAVRFGVMIGIGGGVPSAAHDIRLGDVIVSKPRGTSAGVIQYDFGKAINRQIIPNGSSDKPSKVLLTAMASLAADHMMNGNHLLEHISIMLDKYPKMKERLSYRGANIVRHNIPV
ncbi:hypothetical protein TWF106_006493 [Orbilia oligospora]|uniref:Peptidase S8/S53 domain-containing protein n=1 Tax=Orbilia oligospora TaxID=2813651 RepID=A0A7C8QP11_ORBOL|nr:hypothetical protein TWF106_006493 [Orbilia oligospora]